MVAMLSGMPVARMTMNTERIAKNEGIMVMSRAEGLRNTTRNARKITVAVSRKLCVSVGSSRSVISPARTPLPASWPRTSWKAGLPARAAAQVAST